MTDNGQLCARLLADPMFRLGYGDFWDGYEPQGDTAWTPEECHAYDHGRSFAAFLQNMGEARLVLSRGGVAEARAQHLLLRGLHTGEVG